MIFQRTTLGLLICILSGCAAQTDKASANRHSDEVTQSNRDQLSRHRDTLSIDAKRSAQTVNRPWISGKAQPLSREVTLPAPLRGTVDTVLLYRDRADLIVLAERIQQATGIMVQVNPDTLQPAENFSPRLSPSSSGENKVMASVTTSMNFGVALDSPLPTTGLRSSGPQRASTIPASSTKLTASGPQPLASVLDAIALRLAVYWKYDPNIAAIVFYRTETRTFEIRNAELVAESEVSVGLTGGVGSSARGSGLSSESKSSISMVREREGPIEGIVKRIEQYMTVAGKVAAGPGGLIVVTDTKTSLDQIEKYIDQENRMRGRRIDLVFEEIIIENDTSSQAGVDWNILFQSGGNANGVNITGLNSLLEQEGAALNMGVGIGSGQWSGTSVAVQALSRIGRVVDRKINAFGTNNGQPATTGRPERQKYIAELEQTQSYSDTNAPTVSVTQEEEVSGRVLTVIPYAYSTGDINMTIKYDNTPTPIFERQSMPDGSYVQSPRSVSEVLVRSATLRSGQPIVVNAYSSNTVQYDERRADRRLPMVFGGSDIAGKNERVTVLVLTAMVRE